MLTLNFPIKPYSVNAYYYRNRAIKRREAVEWERSMVEQLRKKEIQESIKKFRDLFDPKKSCIHVDIEITYPIENFFTKQKTISAKSFDVSNTEKPIIDVIFIKKYSTEACKNVEIDDKFITKMTSTKKPGNSHNIKVTISQQDLPDLLDK